MMHQGGVTMEPIARCVEVEDTEEGLRVVMEPSGLTVEEILDLVRRGVDVVVEEEVGN
jgi:energy-converting hydrogenase Eha subunit F